MDRQSYETRRSHSLNRVMIITSLWPTGVLWFHVISLQWLTPPSYPPLDLLHEKRFKTWRQDSLKRSYSISSRDSIADQEEAHLSFLADFSGREDEIKSGPSRRATTRRERYLRLSWLISIRRRIRRKLVNWLQVGGKKRRRPEGEHQHLILSLSLVCIPWVIYRIQYSSSCYAQGRCFFLLGFLFLCYSSCDTEYTQE